MSIRLHWLARSKLHMHSSFFDFFDLNHSFLTFFHLAFLEFSLAIVPTQSQHPAFASLFLGNPTQQVPNFHFTHIIHHQTFLKGNIDLPIRFHFKHLAQHQVIQLEVVFAIRQLIGISACTQTSTQSHKYA
jgi:hypothetical protein